MRISTVSGAFSCFDIKKDRIAAVEKTLKIYKKVLDKYDKKAYTRH